MKENKVNLFIIGAPKCGTTALATYLNSHNEIFMSSPKEPHFFSSKFKDWFYKAESLEQYLALFSNSNDSHKILGEASVLYLYDSSALIKIYDYNPDAKIVVMLRNPIDLAYSWHSQAVYNGDENILDFEKAWRLQKNREEGRNIPKYCRIPETLQYKKIASIGSQLVELHKIFPKEQILYFYLTEMNQNAQLVYKRTLNFLGIEDDNKVDFPRVNSNKIRTRNWLDSFSRSKFFKILRLVKNSIGLKKFSPLSKSSVRNSREVQRNPLSSKFRNELRVEFQKEFQLLEEITGENLIISR